MHSIKFTIRQLSSIWRNLVHSDIQITDWRLTNIQPFGKNNRILDTKSPKNKRLKKTYVLFFPLWGTHWILPKVHLWRTMMICITKAKQIKRIKNLVKSNRRGRPENKNPINQNPQENWDGLRNLKLNSSNKNWSQRTTGKLTATAGKTAALD